MTTEAFGPRGYTAAAWPALRGIMASAALVFMLALAGCAGTPNGPERPPAPDGAAAPGSAEPLHEPESGWGVVEHQVDNRAVALLWDEAEQARREGDLQRAVMTLERAVSVAPDDPVLWSRLAELRLRQQDFAVAENLAAKSNALAGDRRLLRFRNWLIVAQARSRRGDEEGARLARAEARRLRGEGFGQ